MLEMFQNAIVLRRLNIGVPLHRTNSFYVHQLIGIRSTVFCFVKLQLRLLNMLYSRFEHAQANKRSDAVQTRKGHIFFVGDKNRSTKST
jgi:hypothetical protein